MVWCVLHPESHGASFNRRFEGFGLLCISCQTGRVSDQTRRRPPESHIFRPLPTPQGFTSSEEKGLNSVRVASRTDGHERTPRVDDLSEQLPQFGTSLKNLISWQPDGYNVGLFYVRIMSAQENVCPTGFRVVSPRTWIKF